MKKRLALGALLLGVACGVAGCGVDSLEYAPLATAPRALAPRAPETVQVYYQTPPTDRPYVQVGVLSAEESSDSVAGMIGRLQVEAAQRGCDGLVLGAPSSGVRTAPGLVALDILTSAVALQTQPAVWIQHDDTLPVRDLSGACIVYRDPADASGPPLPPIANTTPDPEEAREEAAADQAARDRDPGTAVQPLGVQ